MCKKKVNSQNLETKKHFRLNRKVNLCRRFHKSTSSKIELLTSKENGIFCKASRISIELLSIEFVMIEKKEEVNLLKNAVLCSSFLKMELSLYHSLTISSLHKREDKKIGRVCPLSACITVALPLPKSVDISVVIASTSEIREDKEGREDDGREEGRRRRNR
jgi:hypothetical protein